MDYLIQPGDTLFTIARRFGITLEALLAANPGITNPNNIVPGQRITIPVPAPPGPTPQIYIVRTGDTLGGIARRFGISLNQLLAANPQISNPNVIAPGQRINIPATVPAPPGATMPYTVQPGDTLSLIAGRFGTTVANLLRLNPSITDPNRIFVGQQILVPAATPIPTGAPGCIVYVSDRSGRPELWRSNAKGEQAVQITRESGTAAQPVANPQWAPNGKLIAYQAAGGLFVIDPCGRNPRLLAPEVSSYSWAHDSSRLAFSNPSGSFSVDLQGNQRPISSSLFNPVWFPGDQQLAGTVPENEEIRFAHLATVESSGANFRIIEPPVPAGLVRLSPNGRFAATELFKGYAFGVFETVTVYDFESGNRVTLPGFEIPIPMEVEFVHDISHLGGWAPDSSRLVYSTILDEQGRGEIRIANPQGVILQRFERAYYPVPGWGPVADWIIYTVSEQSGTTAFEATTPRNIYVRNILTNQEVLIAGPGDARAPDWNGVNCLPCS